MSEISEVKIMQIIKSSIRSNSFRFLYQPIYNIETGRMEKIELLIRLRESKFGIISPDVFIPIAEEYNLLYKISDIVFKEACKTIKRLMDNKVDFGRVSINVSLLQLEKCNFIKNTKELLEKYKISPNKICIEVTENSKVKDLCEYKEILRGLSKLGIEIAIDDFGKEYSNIDRIIDLNADCVKIDRCITSQLENSYRARVILKHILSLSKELNIGVVVEGVENHSQLKMLRDYGYTLIQGFYLSEPVDIDCLQSISMMSSNTNKSVIL
ncbi:Bacteriophytochrome cph2 [uncultured Clostridium sp.]|uniref:EAL domain-containing protein n=1 Tax=uncultured Clostridium sp. TaxID=59620 RepID=UPI000820AEF4|nr:EAL domain-containing protein [uncultured Clostridium sp.]SCJ93482.1 Bacteriophytochrome cph2 [uncultured Clostridium sp.]